MFSYCEWHGEIICSIYEQYLERVDRFERMAVAINLRWLCAAIPQFPEFLQRRVTAIAIHKPIQYKVQGIHIVTCAALHLDHHNIEHSLHDRPRLPVPAANN